MDRPDAKVISLFSFIRNGKVRNVQQMLDFGVDINARDGNQQTALMQTVYTQKDDIRTHIVRLLLCKGCDVNAQDDSGRTVLMVAAYERQRDDVVRRIVSSGNCDPNLQDRRGDTALVYAVYGANPSVIRILVNSAQTKNIIDVNKKNNDGINPLKVAFKLKHVECCKVLVEEGGADMNVVRNKETLARLLYQDDRPVDWQQDNEQVKIKGKGRKKAKLSQSSLDDSYIEYVGDTDEYGPEPSKKLRRKRKREKMQKQRFDYSEQNELQMDTLKPMTLSPSAIRNASTDDRYQGWIRSPKDTDSQEYPLHNAFGHQPKPLLPTFISQSPHNRVGMYGYSQNNSTLHVNNGHTPIYDYDDTKSNGYSQTPEQNIYQNEHNQNYEYNRYNNQNGQKLAKLAPLYMPSAVDPFGSDKKECILPAIQTNGSINLISSPNFQRKL